MTSYSWWLLLIVPTCDFVSWFIQDRNKYKCRTLLKAVFPHSILGSLTFTGGQLPKLHSLTKDLSETWHAVYADFYADCFEKLFSQTMICKVKTVSKNRHCHLCLMLLKKKESNLFPMFSVQFNQFNQCAINWWWLHID